jgi:hypothetical protein
MFTLLLVLCAMMAGCTGTEIPAAVHGVLELGSWDFQTRGGFEIEGDWEFHPGLALCPDDFKNGTGSIQPAYIKVPGMWSEGGQKKGFPARGTSTYRLRVINRADPRSRVLILNRIYSGYRIWINGTLAGEKGMAEGKSGGGDYHVFIHNRTVLPYTPSGSGDEIVLQVANWDYASGGIGRPPRIENESGYSRRMSAGYNADMIIVGVVLCFGVANLLFFFFSGRARPSLYLGLFALSLAINNFNLLIPVLSGPMAFPRNPYILDYVTVILMISFIIMTVRSLFPDDFSGLFLGIHMTLSAGALLLLLFLDFRKAETLMSFYFFWIVVTALTTALYSQGPPSEAGNTP